MQQWIAVDYRVFRTESTRNAFVEFVPALIEGLADAEEPDRAVTAFDQRQRYGNYFDFFWRAKRPSDVTVRLEYRQEKLHEHVQAQEISYRNARGTRKTEFKVIGDDYFDDGRVIAWRCLLIENGRIVAQNRSFMWE